MELAAINGKSLPNAMNILQATGISEDTNTTASITNEFSGKSPIFISDYLGLPHQHSEFAFVDTRPRKDTRIFIDPCLIEGGTSDFCNRAHQVVDSFFDVFYSSFRNRLPRQELLGLFMHAHEINAAKLGYGDGHNGKAKTPEGMLSTFKDVQALFKRGLPLSKAVDLPIFVEGFAEDCMSDLLTNILFHELNQFTLTQCELHGYHETAKYKGHYFWDTRSCSWAEYSGSMMTINGAPILLVPKEIVRPSYYCNVEHYIRNEITERMRLERVQVLKGKEVYPNKKGLRDELGKEYGSGRTISIEETSARPYILTSYHEHIPRVCRGMAMTDEELDHFIYLGKWKPKKGKYRTAIR